MPIVILLGAPALTLTVITVLNLLRNQSSTGLNYAVRAAVFTGVVGISLLLWVQPLAEHYADSPTVVHGSPGVLVVQALFMAIGNAYRTLGNPSASLPDQFFAYLFGPGFCEELTKLLPILYIVFKKENGLDRSSWYRDILFVGFGSGLGFGIAEAISPQYSAWNGQNPLFVSQMIRWYSNVPLHALWGLFDVAAIFIGLKFLVRMPKGFIGYGVVLVLIGMGTLHALFDFVGSINFLLMPVVAFLSLLLVTRIPSFDGQESNVESCALSYSIIIGVCLLLTSIAFLWVQSCG